MASILFVSKGGDGYGLATRLAQEGHLVRFYIYDKEIKGAGEGFKNPRLISSLTGASLDGIDLIVFDMVGLGHIAEVLAKRGKLVLGGGRFMDLIELDRSYGQKVAALSSLKIPPTHKFQTSEEGLRFLEKVQKPYVLKPLGNKPTNLTLVSKTSGNELLKDFLSSKEEAKEIGSFLLQEKIEGIEISTEGWFNGKNFIAFNHTIERKRFMEGNKGPNTGCMGNIVWTCEEDKLVKYALLPLTSFLKRQNYIGPLDVNCIVTPQEAYFLEFTARFGYDAIYALLELLKGSLFDLLFGCATGTSLPSFKPYYGIGVRLSLAPYPLGEVEDFKPFKGLRVVEIPEEAKKHVWLHDVMLKDNEVVLSGTGGAFACVTAWGENIRECRRRVYRTISNISLTNDIQYREDIGADKEEEQIEELRGLGWIS